MRYTPIISDNRRARISAAVPLPRPDEYAELHDAREVGSVRRRSRGPCHRGRCHPPTRCPAGASHRLGRLHGPVLDGLVPAPRPDARRPERGTARPRAAQARHPAVRGCSFMAAAVQHRHGGPYRAQRVRQFPAALRPRRGQVPHEQRRIQRRHPGNRGTGLLEGPGRVRPELRGPERERRRGLRLPPRPEGRRPLGRRGGQPCLGRMGGGHARHRLLDHEGRDRDCGVDARGPRSARPRCPGRALLARVRGCRQGADPRPDDPRSPGGASGRGCPSDVRGRPRGRAGGSRPGGAAADLGAGVEARIPRPHVRLASARSSAG